MFPLSASGLPKSIKSAPAELSRVLSRSLGAELTTVPIEDAAELIECSLTQKPCLEAIARSVGVTTIVFGRFEMHAHTAIVRLTSFALGKGESLRTFELDKADDVDAMVKSLEDLLEEAAHPHETPAPVIPLDPRPAPASSSGPTSGTYGMIVGGGIGAGAGLAFLVSANAIRATIDRSPANTRDDIDRLIALEKVGKSRTQVGGVLLAVGGVVATIAIVRMVVQRRRSQPEKPMIDVVPEKGGASVLFTMGWR